MQLTILIIAIASIAYEIKSTECLFFSPRAVARFDNTSGLFSSRIIFGHLPGLRTHIFGAIRNVYCSNASSGVYGSRPANGVRACRLGVHVHVNRLTDGCNSCGGHYNPTNQTHGSATSAVRHIGDLGNVNVNNGIASLFLVGVNVPLSGANSVVGRCLVLHGHTDDLGRGGNPESLINGNSDGRIACANIELI